MVKLQHLKVLHFHANIESKDPKEHCINKTILSELEKTLSINTTLHELAATFETYPGLPSLSANLADIGNSVIKGVTRNKFIQAFLLKWPALLTTAHNQTIRHLLKDNDVLQILKLNIIHYMVPEVGSLLDIGEINTPLNSLEVSMPCQLTSTLVQHMKDLDCLILKDNVSLPLSLFCYSNLQQLQLQIDTADYVTDLFTNLQSNSTIMALKVWIVKIFIFDCMGPSLQKMLMLNQSLIYLEIDSLSWCINIPSTYLSFLITGLSYNTTLKELSVPIPLTNTNNEQITTFFNVISHKKNLMQLKVDFNLDLLYGSNERISDREQKMTPLFYEQGLALITNMLESHTAINLHLQCFSVGRHLCKPNWIKLAQTFWKTIFLHPTLQYIGIMICQDNFNQSSFLGDILKSEEIKLIDMHKKNMSVKPLPIIDLCY